MIVLQIIALFGFLLIGTDLLRRLPRRWAALLWIVVPLLLLPLWLHHAGENRWSLFLWMKIWSVVLACAWFSLCAARPTMSPRAVALTSWLFLAVNILEAAASDWGRGQRVNAIAGVLLVASMGSIWAPRVEEREGSHEIAFDLGWPWIAAYTLWNACFIYVRDIFAFGYQVALLPAALVLALLRGQRSWLIARATTLGLFLLVYTSFNSAFRSGFQTSTWAHPTVMSVLPWLSLAGVLAAAAARLVAGRRAAPIPAQPSESTAP